LFVQLTREKIPDADLCFVKKKVDSIRASFRKELRRVRDSSIITTAATCFEELILDTEMYEQSSESAHARVVKYIRARLPSHQARRAGLASQTRMYMGTLRFSLQEPNQQYKMKQVTSAFVAILITLQTYRRG
jgi:hypothetical protein